MNKTWRNNYAVNNNEYISAALSAFHMSRKRYRRWDEPSYTIISNANSLSFHPDSADWLRKNGDRWEIIPGTEDKVRRFSVREAARIQSFPDDFKFIYENLDLAYKMIGNAVPVNLAYEVAVSIKEQLF